jgi:hypothetical protein
VSAWLAEYGGKLVGGLVGLLASSVVVEIVPIKICPWTAFFQWVGKKINGEITAQLAGISDKLDSHIQEDDQREAKRARIRILRFSDEILKKERHSKEHFCEVLEDITEYNRYCAQHPKFPNDKATISISHIEQTYKERLEKDDFL